MPEFRKKVETFQAERWEGRLDLRGRNILSALERTDVSDCLAIFHLPDGDHLVAPGDWIVRSEDGSLLHVPKDVFLTIYEPVQREKG